jgi:hypothetical protein
MAPGFPCRRGHCRGLAPSIDPRPPHTNKGIAQIELFGSLDVIIAGETCTVRGNGPLRD